MTYSLQNFDYWPESPEQYYKIIKKVDRGKREKMMKTHFYSSIPYF